MTHAVFVPARAKVLESGTVYSKTLQDYVTDSNLCLHACIIGHHSLPLLYKQNYHFSYLISNLSGKNAPFDGAIWCAKLDKTPLIGAVHEGSFTFIVIHDESRRSEERRVGKECSS